MRLQSLLIAALLACSAACSAPQPASERASGAAMWPGLTEAAHEHVNRRLDQIEVLPILQGGVLFVGDSITEAAPLETMFPGVETANQGIGWDTSDGVLLRLGQITRHQPERIFLLIGTNDTNYTDDPARIANNILEITARLSTTLPESELYVLSVLPRGAPLNQTVTGVNEIISVAGGSGDYVYLDLASALRADNDELPPALSDDNLHLNAAGYAIWAEQLDTCVRHGCAEGLGD